MSGRAGRRGMDERGIVILMVDEKMSPTVGKQLLKVTDCIPVLLISSLDRLKRNPLESYGIWLGYIITLRSAGSETPTNPKLKGQQFCQPPAEQELQHRFSAFWLKCSILSVSLRAILPRLCAEI